MRLTNYRPSQKMVLILSLLVFLLPLFLLEYPLLRYSHGIFIYPYDEAYIRMATARNLAFHGVWGLSVTEFNSASSSILFPLLLAAIYKVFGLWSCIPFLINLLAGLLFIWILQGWLLQQGLKAWGQLLILSSVILITPLPVLVITGMEHTLQLALSFLFVVGFSKWLIEQRQASMRAMSLPRSMYLYAALLTSIRYEGLFLVVVACLYLMARRQLRSGILLTLASLLPLVVFGIFSLGKGGYFIPTSLLIKAVPLPLGWGTIRSFLVTDIASRLIYPVNSPGAIATSRILIIVPIVCGLFQHRLRDHPIYKSILLFCLAATLLHLTFSSATLYYRYEGYLIAITLIITGVLVTLYGRILWAKKEEGFRWVVVWAALFLFFPLVWRSLMAYKDINSECLNTMEQSYQQAVFIQRYYRNNVVITDDIGVTSYLSEGKKLDFYNGIGYTPVAKAKEQGYYQAIYIKYLISREVPSLAIIDENRYPAQLLRGWVKVADWYTSSQVILRAARLSFYAVKKENASQLKKQLMDFQPLLPAGSRVVYL